MAVRICSSVLAVSLSAAVAWSADWPGWRGPNRDGKSAETGLLKQWPQGGPKLLWKASGIGKGFSSMAVVGDMVYTAGDVGNQMVVFALDGNGQVKWRAAHDAAWTKSHAGSRSTPTIDNGNLYILSGNGKIGCYDAASGQAKWARHARDFGGSPHGWGYAESVLILDDLAIFTPGGERCIVALNKKTGEPVWTTKGWKAAPQYSSNYAFQHDGHTFVANGTHEGIACIYPKNGNLLWYNAFSAHNTANCPTPVYADGHVFWANGYGKGGICLKVNVQGNNVTATEAWKTRDMVCHHGGYIVHEGYIYGNNGGGCNRGGCNGGWACLDLKTGRTMWKTQGPGKGSLCFADGMLYLFGETGGRAGLATCSPEGMEMRGQFSVQGSGPSWAHPVVANGRLYLRYDTNLYCYDVKAR